MTQPGSHRINNPCYSEDELAERFENLGIEDSPPSASAGYLAIDDWRSSAPLPSCGVEPEIALHDSDAHAVSNAWMGRYACNVM